MADDSSRSGVSYMVRDVVEWTNRVHAPHDHGLAKAFDTPRVASIPAIHVGASEGKLLAMLLAMVGAKRVVEIGTLAGYSAIRLAQAVGAVGHVWSVELEEKHAALARQNLATAGVSDRVTVEVGPALEVLPRLEAHGPFDAVFIDADKGNYDRYGRWAAAHLRRGGLLLGDNAFFFGKLLEDSPAAGAMRRFHEESRDAFETVCIPTPDGLLLGVRH